jgi:hypothetical protein
MPAPLRCDDYDDDDNDDHDEGTHTFHSVLINEEGRVRLLSLCVDALPIIYCCLSLIPQWD